MPNPWRIDEMSDIIDSSEKMASKRGAAGKYAEISGGTEY
jgi:hypothetical protein